MDIAQLIQSIAIRAIPVLFSITVCTSRPRLRGPALRRQHRLHARPHHAEPDFRHIDPIGTILMPLLLLFTTSGGFLFGYAKPVPVRFGNLRNPKRDMIWVALSGPAANLVQSLAWGILLLVLGALEVSEPYFFAVCKAGVTVNVVMFVFNLFPMPPLDGGRILVGLLPYQQAVAVSRIEPWGFFIVMALVISGVLSNIWMRPLMSLTFGLLDMLLMPLAMIFR